MKAKWIVNMTLLYILTMFYQNLLRYHADMQEGLLPSSNTNITIILDFYKFHDNLTDSACIRWLWQ